MGRNSSNIAWDGMALVRSSIPADSMCPTSLTCGQNQCVSLERLPCPGGPADRCRKVETECQSSTSTSTQRKDDQYYCEKDLYCQIQTISTLLSGAFYHQHMNSTDAKGILKSCPVGTFLVRNSSDCKYLYTISVKTRRGPTSIRINYEHGRYSLDAEETSKRRMLKFPSLMNLIDHYVRVTARKNPEQCLFRDKHGRKDLPIILTKPILSGVPSLKHMARTCINRTLNVDSAADVPTAADNLPLPRPLRSFIKDYPYVY